MDMSNVLFIAFNCLMINYTYFIAMVFDLLPLRIM